MKKLPTTHITMSDAARMIGRTETVVRRAVNRGLIPIAGYIGRATMVDVADVQRWNVERFKKRKKPTKG